MSTLLACEPKGKYLLKIIDIDDNWRTRQNLPFVHIRFRILDADTKHSKGCICSWMIFSNDEELPKKLGDFLGNALNVSKLSTIMIKNAFRGNINGIKIGAIVKEKGIKFLSVSQEKETL